MTEWPRPLALLMLLAAGAGLLIQAAPGPATWLDLVSAGGVPGILVLGLWGFYKEWLVSGAQYRRERDRADRLERMLYAALNVSEKVAHVVEQSAGTL